MSLNALKDHFFSVFQQEAAQACFCPGRVNLIGEHIDYNGGQVMPCAISMGTTLLMAPNHSGLLRFGATGFPEMANIPLAASYAKTGEAWYNYPLGVFHYLQQRGMPLQGFDMLFSGNLPIGAGLSSSASIEVLTAYALNRYFNLGIGNVDIALLAKQVENEFMGLNCGIMDQFAVSMGKKHRAILLDCDTLAYEYLPFDTGDYCLAIINSNKPRKLVGSKYNERFAECREALKRLQGGLAISHLCEIGRDTFEQKRHLINDPVLEQRAEHVISENERVKAARTALAAGRLDEFGALMYQSHESLQHLYEVSGAELDTIVEFCKGFDGCAGARMTGAGFGGCAIALIRKDRFEAFGAGLVPFYTERIGYEPAVFQSAIADGVSLI